MTSITVLKQVSRNLSAPLLRKQRGVATILVILMVGVGLVSVSLGTLHAVRSTQERQLVAHAQVNAQSAVWATVDVVRQYLKTLTPAQVAGLTTNSPWTISGNDSLVQSVTIVRVEAVPTTNAYRITAHVTATATAAQSSSVLEVVYEVTPATGGGNVVLNGVLDFYNDLTLNGGITMKVPGGANINVDGDFTAKGSVVGMDGYGLGTIAVTGSVSVGSDIAAQELRGKNVTITGGSTAKRIYAFGDPDATGDDCCGNVEMTGGTGAEIIQANGNIKLAGGDVSMTIDARRDITVDRGGSNHGVLTAGRDIFAKSASSIKATRSIGNTNVESIFGLPIMQANANITCAPGMSWMVYPSITAGGTIKNCTPGAVYKPGTMPSPGIVVIPKVPKVVMTQPVVDAWAVRPTANYIFEYKNNAMMVTVQNVNGIANGEYYLGTFNNTNQRQFLCTAIDASTKKCTSPAASTQAKTICNGFAAENGCFSYVVADKQWQIRGKNMAPGVAWFTGNVDIGTGEYYNTFVASGNIISSGSLNVYALNQAGYDVVCENAFKTNMTSLFAGLYPTNFCNTSAKKMLPNSLGNIGLLAGGFDPALNTDTAAAPVYSGGYVSLTAGNRIYGTVLAGNLLSTSGSTYIYGYVSAAGLRNLDTEENNMGGSTTIDLTGIPPGSDPGLVPDMGGGNANPSSVVLWSRYL